MKKLTVGEMAKLNNISKQTLRYYDKIGLVSPEKVDDKTGYRYYNINQSAKLDLINQMKYLGMPLEKIKILFEKNDIKLIEKNIDMQLECIFEEKKKLEIMEKAALKFKNNLKEYRMESKKKGVEIRKFGRRKIFCYDGKINIYENDMESFEYILRELKKQVMVKNLPMVYFCNIGSIIRKENLLRNKYYSSEIFVFLENSFPPEKNVEVVPEGKYACISFKGEEGFSNELEYAEKLLSYVKDNNYKINGDYICEVITELPLFKNKTREMYIRLQVPIK
ncbi:MAG: MerR family transcriptional regulator [Eubacteriales bacterium]